jgi:uncharacterized membrane-anchored protein
MSLLIAIVLCSIGAFISGLNFYLSFIRYPLHRLRGRSRAEFHWVSGFPVIGSLLLWICAVRLTAWPILMWAALAISLLDTGGLHWFAFVILFRSKGMPWRFGKD